MHLSSRLLKNTFAPRITLQSHAQEEVSIAFLLEPQDLIFVFSFHAGEREGELCFWLLLFFWTYTQFKDYLKIP